MFEDTKMTIFLFPLSGQDSMDAVQQFLRIELEEGWVPVFSRKLLKYNENFLEVIMFKYGKDKTIA